MTLDLTVSSRQALDGSYNERTVDTLLQGALTMPPHLVRALPGGIDWAASPFTDLDRQDQHHMLPWLDPLRRAAQRGDDAAFDMWIRYVRDWVRSDPRESPTGAGSWRDGVEAARAIQLCLAAALVSERSPEDLPWLEQSIRDHAELLADSGDLGTADHALAQHEALLVCGRILQDEHLTQLAISRFEGFLHEAYDAQGVTGDGGVARLRDNYLRYERALERFDAEGMPRPSAAGRHALAPEVIAHMTRPDGTFVAIGDTYSGSPRDVGSPLTDYVSSGGAEGEPPDDLLKVLDRGYLFARSGWGETEKNLDEETFLSVSFGPADRVHGHPDGGSLTFSAETVNWLVDPGTCQDGGLIPREHLESRASHNLVSIEGRAPRTDARVTLDRQHLTDRSYDFLFSDDSYDGVTLTRRLIYSTGGDYLVVIDHVRSPQECTASQRWQLGPEVESTVSRHRVELTSGDRRAVICFAGTATALSQVRGQASPFDGWVAAGGRTATEATAVRATKSGTNFRFITIIAAGKDSHPTARTVPVSVPGFCLEVSTGRVTEHIIVGKDSVSFPEEPPMKDAPAAPSAAPAPPTDSAPTHHLDRRCRREVFAAITEARVAARAEGSAERASRADALEALASERGLTGDVDLGIAAAVSDLRGTVRGRIDPKKIQPHRTALVNWDDDPTWRPTFYRLPVIDHRDSFTLDPAPAEAAIHTVDIGPFVLPVALQPDPGRILTVLFQGAVDRARVRIPIFLRWRYQLSLGAGPTLAIADPTLDLSDSMRLGWYLGNDELDLAPRIAHLVRETADALDCSEIVLAGSSGGGFAALQVGAHLPDSTILAMSPQTDLRGYSPRLVRSAVEPALGVRSLSEEGVAEERISVPARMAARGTYPRVHLLSNPGDTIHVKRHEGPLRDAYEAAGRSTSISTSSVDLGPGHRSVDNDTYGEHLRRIYDLL